MKILIVYATYSGTTEETAFYMQSVLQSKDHEVSVIRISDVRVADFAKYDIVVFGTPSWLQNGLQGQPHTHYFIFMEEHDDTLFENQKIALFGLGDETYAYYCGAVDILEKFFKNREACIVTSPLKMENFHVQREVKMKIVETWVDSLIKSA